ncbi:Signal transduction histidine kinase [Mucilaginibacter sp. NFR10]|nr:Signal transduction histidine kinase [Mucilaginibacter sp. NFR10]
MLKFKSCYILTCLLFLCVPSQIYGQAAINFTSITIKEGLSSNTVNTIIKDRFGLMWFGTGNGLNKFDGSNFVIYRHGASGNSIPSNEVLSMFEDKSGRIWVGTSGGGLSYYNRKFDRFEPFRGDGSWREISDISVRAICQDHQGKLWVGTYEDLRIIDAKTGRITPVKIPEPDKKDAGAFVVLSLFEDSRQRMWIGTNYGLYLYEWSSNSFKRFSHNEQGRYTLSNNTVKAIIEDRKGSIWFGTYDGLNKWTDDGHFEIFRSGNQSPLGLDNNAIFTMCLAKDGKIWIGTEGGVNLFDPQLEVFQQLTADPRNAGSLKSNSIRSIFIDPAGIYWVGTFTEGIGKYDPHLALFNHKKSDPFDPLGLKSPLVTAFAECSNGGIFVGTDAGIALLDKKTGLLHSYDIQSKLKRRGSSLAVTSLYIDRKGNLWAGTYHNGLFRIDTATHRYVQYTAEGNGHGICSNDITCINADASGRIWIGTLGRGIDIYDENSHSFSHLTSQNGAGGQSRSLPVNGFISSIIPGRDGRMWIASMGTGIVVLDTEHQKWTHYNKKNSALADDVVLNLFITNDGSVWSGTKQGISYFDENQKKFISYGEDQGLANSFVKSILQDDKGFLWLSTDRGISSFDYKRRVFRNFTNENGVQQGAFSSGSGIKTRDGNLYFGGQDGFNFFNPSRLPVVSRPGRVILSNLTVDNAIVNPGNESPIHEHISTAKEITLKYGQNFSIGYVALDYTSPKQNLYAYRLKGFDKAWNYVQNIRTASYTNIDPGTYSFEVMASKDENHWNNPVTTIRITILPPFWRTVYAYIAYVVILGSALFFIRRRGIQKIRRQFEQAQEKLQVSQLIEQERREAERLHELDLLKIKFLTDLSHEFRTPVSLILAPVEKLLEKSVPGNDIEDLKMINRNGRRLLNLVNQLLDFRKMEEQKLKLSLSAGEIMSFITESCEAFQDLALKKQVTLEVDVQQEEVRAYFDPDKLERVIFNLLSNAFKFTPAGGVVSVSARAEKSSLLSTGLLLKVTDTGIGIQADDLEKIFERFYQSRQSSAIVNQGTGIGLSITKEFIELHGGTIQAESIAGQGTSFLVRLPLTAAVEAGTSETPPVSDRENAKERQARSENPELKPTVLLVEDNDEFRSYLSDHLKKYYHIIEAAHGKEGWQKTLGAHVNLVVSDINMPHMDGIELSKKIKADKRTCHTPVILLTATTGEEHQLKGLKTGANDYLTKPFNFQILQTKIDNLLDLNKNLKDTYSRQIQMVSPQVEMESADVKLLNSVMKYIEDQLSEPGLSVEELSRHVGMSRGSLYYKLLEITGQTPVEYIRNVKLDKAAQLLEISDYNVAQIAYITGFGTPSYFSRIFKTRFGMLPSEYMIIKRNMSKNKATPAI